MAPGRTNDSNDQPAEDDSGPMDNAFEKAMPWARNAGMEQ
jgi:hypothetical protein